MLVYTGVRQGGKFRGLDGSCEVSNDGGVDDTRGIWKGFHPETKKTQDRNLCEHRRQKSKSKDCGGSDICEHQRERSKCKEDS